MFNFFNNERWQRNNGNNSKPELKRISTQKKKFELWDWTKLAMKRKVKASKKEEKLDKHKIRKNGLDCQLNGNKML